MLAIFPSAGLLCASDQANLTSVPTLIANVDNGDIMSTVHEDDHARLFFEALQDESRKVALQQQRCRRCLATRIDQHEGFILHTRSIRVTQAGPTAREVEDKVIIYSALGPCRLDGPTDRIFCGLAVVECCDILNSTSFGQICDLLGISYAPDLLRAVFVIQGHNQHMNAVVLAVEDWSCPLVVGLAIHLSIAGSDALIHRKHGHTTCGTWFI
mmetsp:Transcript_26363/g.47507  ORF Transcript_26363/g.47507 Transcript_26363/m.47507 type:complete len:213 (+) Transcript_26363:480-1118(+)